MIYAVVLVNYFILFLNVLTFKYCGHMLGNLVLQSSEKSFIHNSKIAVRLEGSCLKQNITSFRHINIVNLFIVHELDT